MSRSALLLALVLLLGACGDSTSAIDSAAPDPDIDATSTTPNTTLLDVANTADLNTFVLAATQAGLEDILTDTGPATVFAPSDDAFAALQPGTLEILLLPENQETLRSLLTYHILPRTVRSGQLEGDLSVETINGEALTINATEGGVTLTDALGGSAEVVTADLEADNGVLHVIDAVLLPATPEEMMMAPGGAR